MKIEFTDEARDDLFDAIDYYEAKEIGLGLRFRYQIEGVIRTVISAPTLWRERKGGYRQVNCPVFPYCIAYVIRDRTIIVIAVTHASRKPGFWHDRFDK